MLAAPPLLWEKLIMNKQENNREIEEENMYPPILTNWQSGICGHDEEGNP